jgi:hypothetical protein
MHRPRSKDSNSKMNTSYINRRAPPHGTPPESEFHQSQPRTQTGGLQVNNVKVCVLCYDSKEITFDLYRNIKSAPLCRLTDIIDPHIIMFSYLRMHVYVPTRLPTCTGRMPYTTSGTRRAGIDVARRQLQFGDIPLSLRRRLVGQGRPSCFRLCRLSKHRELWRNQLST